MSNAANEAESAATAASSDAGRPNVPAEWNQLELSVRRLLDEVERCHRRSRAAESRINELDDAVERLSSGELDPVELQRRVDSLEEENERLREKLDRAGATVDRILDRLEFMEDVRE